jgi:WD40 repeat protein
MMNTTDPKRLNPFPGLRPFRSDENHLFFGREEQTAALLQLLRSNRFLAVVGTSGSGKSSLVRAGMIAELHGGTMTQAGSTWEVMILRPGGSPIENLARAFIDADLYDPADPSTLPRLLATLNRSRFGLVEAMKQSDVFEPGSNLLVVVDQFEELFRYRQQGVDSEELAAAFVNLLLTASEQPERPIYVTITMRSDYLGDCSEIPGLAEAVNEGEYLIPRLLRDQKRDAIEKPIGVGGAKISTLLVQRLLNEVGDDPDQLPVLQHALMRMWNVWSADSDHNRPIDFGDLEATGGLGAALSNHADEIYDSLPNGRHRSACEKILKALTVKGNDNRGIRRPTRLAQLEAIADSDRDTVTTVLDAFRGAGVTFLMPGTEVELGDRTVLDLSHESLMRGWQRLRGWVEEEAQSARIFRRLLDTARLWSDGRAGLFRDPDLQIALTWREQESPNAKWAEQYGGHFEKAIGFLESSNADAEAERQAREAAQQRELAQAQELAEVQRQRLEQQQRAARRLRKLIAGLAVVALIAGLACVLALVARNEAGKLAQIAAAEAENARNNAQRAEQSKEQTAQALTQVAAQKDAVQASLTKAEKAEQVARAAEEAGRKLLYATDMKLAPFIWNDPQATAAQLRSRLDAHDPRKNQSLAGKDDLRGFEWHYYQHLLESSSTVLNAGTVAISNFVLPDDGPLVTLDRQGRLKHWDPDTHRETASLDTGLPSTNVPAYEEDISNRHPKGLSANGKRLASAVGKKVQVRDTTTGAVSYQFESTGVIWDLSFSPDGRFLVTHDGRRTQWFDATNGQSIAHFDQAIADFHIRRPRLSLSADGLTLAVWAQGNIGNQISIFRLDATTKKVSPVAEALDNRGSLGSAALSPDGKLIAVGLVFTGGLLVYETASRQLIAALSSAHASPVRAIAFSRNGLDLATADAEGIIKTWGDARKLTSNSEAQRTLKGHAAAITKVAFSTTGKQLVSASWDGTVRLWGLEQSLSATRRLQAGNVAPVFFAGGRLIARAERNRVTIWDAASSQRLRSLADGSTILSLAVSPDDRLLAVGRLAETGPPPPFRPSFLSLWEMDTGRRLAEFFDRDDAWYSHSAYDALETLAFSPDGKFLVAGFGTRWSHFSYATIDLKVWEVATLREYKRLVGHSNACVSICFSPDGTRMASGSHDATARIWDTATWQVVGGPLTVGDPQILDNSVEAVAFSPDGRTLAMATMSGSILLWNTKTRERTTLPKAHANGVLCIAFSPDGRTLASGSLDETIRLWNVATGRELLILNSKDLNMGQVRSLAFSPDGTQLLASGQTMLASGAVVWSAAPSVWDNPKWAGNQLRPLLRSPAEFRNRIRMWSEIPGLRESLETLDTKDPQAQAAQAAIRANRDAAHRRWPDATKEYDRLKRICPDEPQAWLRTPGLLRVATALLHQGRPAVAATLLTGGAECRTQDGLPPITETVGLGFAHRKAGDAIRVSQLVPGSPAANSKLQVDDVLLKINDVDVTTATLAKLVDVKAGTRVRLTVRHSRDDQTEVIELARERYLPDPETGELWRPLLAAIEAGLAKNLRDADLLELRAELAGQWSGFAEQVRDYTAAIDQLTTQPKEKVEADLQRLYRRRGDAHFRLKQWQTAVDDYARGVTAETRDHELLSRRAQACEQLGNWPAASTDWKRALEANPDAGRLHAEFAKRLTNANQSQLAGSHRKQAQTCFEAQLAREPENSVLAEELAEVLLLQSTSAWTVLKPTEMQTAGGATLTLLDDGSILSSGKHPDRDDYTVKAPTGVKDIRAIALDVLPYGRGESALSIITGFGVSQRDDSGSQRPVALKQAAADFETTNQWGSWVARTVIEGKDDGRGWAINPMFKPHRLVVKPGQPIVAGTTALAVVLQQHHFNAAHPRGLLIGRFRLSVSDDPAAFEREANRFAAMKLTDPWAVLGAAYALNGRHRDALPYFSRALERADGYQARKPILEFAARFDEVLQALVQQQPDDLQLQLALARKLAEQGKQRLAEKQAAKAEAELQKCREIFTRLRAKHPQPRWTVLKPTAMTSEGGATLTLQDDGSVLASGENLDSDTYTLTAPIAGGAIAGLRLETIPDARLPGRGAGRADSTGEFLLSEIEAALQNNGTGDLPLVIKDGFADFSRDVQPIAYAFDSNSSTHWGVFPRLTEPHTAVFLLGPYPPQQGESRHLTIRLRCGGNDFHRYNLGRFRLSVTNDAEALKTAPVRNDLKDSEVVDLSIALAKAQAQQGNLNEAAASFTDALDLAAAPAGKAKIIAEAALREGMLERLAKRVPGDAQFQAELARHFAQRGSAPAAPPKGKIDKQ